MRSCITCIELRPEPGLLSGFSDGDVGGAAVLGTSRKTGRADGKAERQKRTEREGLPHLRRRMEEEESRAFPDYGCFHHSSRIIDLVHDQKDQEMAFLVAQDSDLAIPWRRNRIGCGKKSEGGRHAGGGGRGALARSVRSLVAQSLSEEQQEKEQKEGERERERERLPRKAVKAALPSLFPSLARRPPTGRRSAFRCYFVVGK